MIFLLSEPCQHQVQQGAAFWKATPSIHMCSIRCSKPQGHQGPPTSCMRGLPLSESTAEELAAEGLVEGNLAVPWAPM